MTQVTVTQQMSENSEVLLSEFPTNFPMTERDWIYHPQQSLLPPQKLLTAFGAFLFFRSPQKGSLASMIKIKKAIEMSLWNQV